MSSKYVLYRSRKEFEAKHALGIFTESELKAYLMGTSVDGDYLVLDDRLFGKLRRVSEVEFLRGLWHAQMSAASVQRSDGIMTPLESFDNPSGFPVEVLSADARQLVMNRVTELRNLIALTSGLARDAAASDDPAMRKEFDRISREFPMNAMQKDFDSLLGFLSHHAAWTESETSPVHWDMHGTESKFFQDAIVGAVFLYRNRFIAVGGSKTIDEKRRMVVAACKDL